MERAKVRIFEIIEKADTKDRASFIFDSMIIFLIVLNVTSIILESFSELYSVYTVHFRVFEIFSVMVFTIEYILRIWTSDILYKNENITRITAIKRYLLSPMAVIDLVAILPFYLPFIVRLDLRFLRMLRVTRFLRMFKFNRYSQSFSLIGKVLSNKKETLVATILITFFLVVMSSIMMFYAEGHVQEEAFPNIVLTFRWAIATLTTIGYGDVYPVTGIGKLLASVIALLGIGIVAIPTGIISTGFMEVLQKKEENEGNICLVVCPHCQNELNAAKHIDDKYEIVIKEK
jgi:voltage-gated potassium channel